MEFQIAFWISLAILAGVIIYLVVVKKESNRYLTAYKPVKTERDKLKEENVSLQKRLEAAQADVSSLKAEHKENKKNHKAASKAAVTADKSTKELSEIEQKLADANTDIKKLKQENFDLRRDNKELLKEKQERGVGDTENSKMIVELRDARDKANEALGRATARIAELEKARGNETVSKQNEADVASSSNGDMERVEALERDKKAVEQTLQEVRNELAEFKKGYREKLEEAKKESSTEVKSFKDEIEQLKRQLQQSKTRADNNHRIFLIARAQLMLAEKRLALFDGSYKPIALGTSSTAIDEMIKKFLTHDIRESRASADVIERDRKINDLVLEVKSLKKQLAEAQNTANAVQLSNAIKEDSKKTDSIESLVSSLTDDLNIKPSNDVFSDFSFDNLIAPTKSDDKAQESTSLKGLDFSGFGEDSWDAF